MKEEERERGGKARQKGGREGGRDLAASGKCDMAVAKGEGGEGLIRREGNLMERRESDGEIGLNCCFNMKKNREYLPSVGEKAKNVGRRRN